MVTLTHDFIAESLQKQQQQQKKKKNESSALFELSLPGKDIHKISSLETLTNLVRLDLSRNRLTSIEGLSSCKKLKWLSVAQNELKTLHGVEPLIHLSVLNGCRNQIKSMKEVENLPHLCALILNDNEIHSICKLKNLTSLNTLVLSRNPISSPGKAFKGLSSLAKLSLSDCELQDLDWLKGLGALKELRLAHNKITVLPDVIGGMQLRILDLGNNDLKTLSKIHVLNLLRSLENLNLRGNPLCSKATYEDEVKKLLPHLSVLDGHSLQRDKKNKFLKRQLSPDMQKVRTSDRTEDDKNLVHLEKGEERKANGMYDGKAVSNTIEDETEDQIVDAHHDIEEKPFFDLIMQQEDSTTKAVELEVKEKTMKEDSGLVSITNKKKRARREKAGQNSTKGSSFFASVEEVTIGCGGPSQWDM